MSAAVPDPSTVTKRDRIVVELRRRILVGEHSRGERLRQDVLARDFGTSITPIREALGLLESEGLVSSEPHKGVRVAGVDLDRVLGIYVLRRSVEPFAISRAVERMSRRDLAEQRRILDEMASAATDPDYDLRESNRRFHFAFYERCGLPGLAIQIGSLWDSFPWDLTIDDEHRGAESRREHEDMLRAAVDGEAQVASDALSRHLASSLAAIRYRLTGEHGVDPFDEP